ncbi:putative leucine-rich repeat-containing protein DDB_G0290503 isoform X2 [Magallana gigas]|uniref:putative leucine-rich repeat-containing protein DDB_G0290503 isoform X2 n=1 Tax=Magallana gigas TaxID=29159 RepID=UPI003342E1AD
MPPFTNSLQKLQESLNELKSEIDKYHCPKCGVRLESYEESNSATVTPSYNQLEDRILDLQNECKSLASKNKEYKEKIAEQEHTISEQFKELDRLRDACTELKQGSSNELEKTTSEQLAEISQLKVAAKAFAEEEEKLKREISERDKYIERLNSTQKTNKEQYEKSIQRLEDENKRYKEKLKSSQSEVDKLSAKLAEKDRINNDLVSRRLEIEGVGFHTTVAPSMSSLILGGLTSRLTDRLAGEKVDLVRQAYSGGPDVNFPLLVVCVNVSRIGADAKEALKGIPKAKDVALLVFHHKEAHALPSQTSDKILTGADFSGLGSIIDLAFLSQRGIYECDMNNVGIERVASFLLQYKTQRK